MVAAVGCVDGFTGNELSFAVCYLLPVAYAACFLSTRLAVLVAVACAATLFSIEMSQNPVYSHPLIPVWNASMRLMFFFLGIAVLTAIRRSEVRARALTEERTRILAEESQLRRRLEREMLEMSAGEQVRLAEDLHDGLGQYLSALSFQARMLSDDLRKEGSPQLERAERIVALIRTTNQITRRIDQALRVPAAGPGGLLAGIRGLAGEFEQLTGVRFEVENTGDLPAFDEFQTLMLFRIAQEAFSNAVKHGNPRVIRTLLRRADGALTICVVNDGPPGAGPVESLGGAGLRIMRLRSELIGARFQASVQPTGGFKVECSVPLPGFSSVSNRQSPS